MTKVQLGAEILRWEQKEKVGSVENYSWELLIKEESWKKGSAE